MKICFASHRYAPMIGGYENQIRLLAENLPPQFEAKVVTFNMNGWRQTESLNRVQIHRVKPNLTLFRVPLSLDFLSTLRKLDFDVLHAHGFVPLVSDLSLVGAKMVGRSVVYTHHFDGNVQDSWLLNLAANFYNSSLGRASVGFADKIVATSKSYAYSSPVLQHLMRKVSVIPCAVDCDLFKPQFAESVMLLRRQLGLTNQRVVLFVGRVVPYKGVQYLIRAIQKLNQRGEAYHILIVGDAEGRQITDSSLYYQSIRDLVVTCGLEELVDFVGRLNSDQLPLYYSLADVVVLPSVMRGEAFGGVLLESLACGSPVVASNLPGVDSVLKENRKVGRYVTPKDEEGLAEAIRKVAETKSEVTETCRSFALENYGIKKVVSDYVNLYESLD
jgi:glycosyltransferase involved in cell wall biosynthesis